MRMETVIVLVISAIIILVVTALVTLAIVSYKRKIAKKNDLIMEESYNWQQQLNQVRDEAENAFSSDENLNEFSRDVIVNVTFRRIVQKEKKEGNAK